MGYESKITSKGQTTVPVEVRESLGLNTGDKIAYVKTAQGYLIIPRNRPVSDLFGLLSEYAIPGTTIEDYDNAIGEGISEHVEGAARDYNGSRA
jgi:antitoxin PrlF